MTTSTTNRFRPSIDALENRDVPSGLTISPPGWLDPGAAPFIAAQSAGSANAQTRPFHLEESGSAVINGLTINASASGTATHLGAFTLTDTSTIVGIDPTAEGVILHVAFGRADLEAANGDHLYASFSGSVNFTTGEGTLNFEWTGGTGRFADATGTTLWHIDVNRADLTYTVVADGVIRY